MKSFESIIDVNARVIIWGAGEVGCELYTYINNWLPNITIVGVVDSIRKNIKGVEFVGNIVDTNELIRHAEFDYIIVATKVKNYQSQIIAAIEQENIGYGDIIVYEGMSQLIFFPMLVRRDPFIKKHFSLLIENSLKELDHECVNDELKSIKTHASMMMYFKTARRWYLTNDEKCAFLDIPKCAGTSIKKSMYSIKEDQDVYKTTLKYAILGNLQEEITTYKFAFVRDPFSRVLSCYKNKIEGREKSLLAGYGYLPIEGVSSDKGFAAFVEAISEIPDMWSDVHFKSQYNYLYENGKLLVDYIGRMEQIIADYKFLEDNYGLQPIQHENRNEKYELVEYYTKELVQKIYKRYQNDVEILGYKHIYQELMTDCNN